MHRVRITGPIAIRLIAVLLSALSVSTLVFSAAEIPVLDDSGQTCQNDAGSPALVGHHALLLLHEAQTYIYAEEAEVFHQPLSIFRNTYRGPPILF